MKKMPEHPKIVSPSTPEDSLYLLALKQMLHKVLPIECFEEKELLLKHLPLIEWTPLKVAPPFYISFFLCCIHRPNAFRFFQEMICRWLIPGEGVKTSSLFAIDFYVPDLGTELYTGGEVTLCIETEQQLFAVEKNLPILETELRLGVRSSYQANRILEIKGLTCDEKTALIQANIHQLVKNRPQDFDYDIFTEMQHFLVLCKEDFKSIRSFKHMSRIICFFYLFRKVLRHSREAFPDKRFVSLKFFKVSLDASRKKRVLGAVIALSFLKENELFTQRHILKAMQSILPSLNIVKGSYFKDASRGDQPCLIYVEMEKGEDEPFTLEETQLLKEALPDVLLESIEKSYNPIFMPQNEEEILRNILSLASQLKFLRDLPQAIISFESQTDTHLMFLVVMVRLLKPSSVTIQDLFETRPTFLHFIPDRIKSVGSLRKKYLKEANVFRLKVAKEPFLRHDNSVDLYKARGEVSEEIARIVGDFRDFNGGTISKESELFTNFLESVGKKEHSFLIENFFYSIEPPIMRSVLKPSVLKKLFFFLLSASTQKRKEREKIEIFVENDADFSYLVILSKDSAFRSTIQGVIERENGLFEGQIASCFVCQNGLYCMGILNRITDQESALKLLFEIEEAVMPTGV